MSSPHLRQVDDDAIRQAWGTIAENATGLDEAVAGESVTALNDHLSGLYILFNQLRKHRWLVDGAETGDVEDALGAAADRLTETTDELARRVVELGGVPVCGPMGVREHAHLFVEPPHSYDLRSSLERDRVAYETLAVQVREHVRAATDRGDTTTSSLLRRHLLTLETDAHTLTRYLADDTLVRAE